MSELWGLRGRLVLALVAVCALTLAITAVLLLVPLDRKLRQDVRAGVVSTARASRPSLARLPAAALAPGSARLHATAETLRRRTKLDIAIFDATGRRLIATDASPQDTYPEVAHALRTGRTTSKFGRGDGRDQAQVALPVDGEAGTFVVSFRKGISDLSGAEDVVRRSLVAAAFVALGVALLLGIAIASQLVRRVTELRDVALRVAAEGPGAATVRDDGGHDEIADLRRAFATMQRRLEEQEAARRSFVATASHELRTPLASLQLLLHGVAEDLAAPSPDLVDAHDQLTRALTQTERLGKLAEELLDLSRLDAGVPLRTEPVDLAGVARSVVAELAPLARGDRVTLDAPEPAWAAADPGAVARIVRIVVDNALRHGEHVRVRVDPARVAVSDDGPGVAETDAERVFQRFERGDDGGFGLGLAIGRELARRMGGDLVLLGSGPGATFEARLPPLDTVVS